MTPSQPNALIAAAPDFIAPYLYDAAVSALPEWNIWMLGTGPLAGIPVDLAVESVTLPAPMDVVIYADGTDSSHLDPVKAMPAVRNLTASLAAAPPRSMVYISSAAVYGLTRGEAVGEDAPLHPATPYAQAKCDVEKYLTDWCREHKVTLAILRPAPVVGTGMGGPIRDIVNRIYRATYRHIAGDEARMSVVHAVDVARAAVMLAGHSGVFNITDGVDPTRHDLAEALCSRLDRKRVYTLPLGKLKIMARIGDYLPVTGYNTSRLDAQLSTLTFDSSRLRSELPGFEPVSVTEYLTTHVYDDTSR